MWHISVNQTVLGSNDSYFDFRCTNGREEQAGIALNLKQWFSKCGPWTSGLGITWQLAENSHL